MRADSRSTTSTIPNGAGQSPSRYTPATPVGAASAARAARSRSPTSAKVDATLIAALRLRCRSPPRSITAPASSGSTTGAIIRWSASGSRFRLPAVDVVGARQAARCEQHDQEQRRRREADDDGGQDERLRQRIGVLRRDRRASRAARIGAAPVRSRPMATMKRLTA